MLRRTLLGAFASLALSALAPATIAQPAATPAAKEATWVAKDFKFHTGDVLPELKLHYRTVGEPTGEPVLVLHGTAGNGGGMLAPAFATELIGAGKPLDPAKYFIILPDALGAGKSGKPSDGLKGKFPRYNYEDMVQAQYRLVTEGIGIKHVRLIIGNSMGGMHAWVWGVTYPDFMDALVPMASQPTEMSGRNWMMRRLLIDTIRNDPDYANGDYAGQLKSVQRGYNMYAVATNGGNQGWQQLAGTRAKADKLIDDMTSAPFTADPNDFVYQWDASRDYNPAPKLDKITAALLAINSADDERNPPELGVMEREIARIKGGRLLLVPGSPDTRGHGTTFSSKHWAAQLKALLDSAPKRAM
jgi:homoserine O-acetyltransferase/O-succinyltransferase